jgi:hypothetical protein
MTENAITLYEALIFTAWTLSIFGAGYYFGMDRRDREAKAKEVIDSLEDV